MLINEYYVENFQGFRNNAILHTTMGLGYDIIQIKTKINVR